jgi:hypothetical protein
MSKSPFFSAQLRVLAEGFDHTPVAPGCRDDTVAARQGVSGDLGPEAPRHPVMNQTFRSATLASFEEVVPLSRRETARY